MKSIYWYSIVLFITAFAFTGCKKMDSNYKQFIVPGGLTYTGKVNSPMAYAGHNRIKISWLRGSDPNVTRAMIYWDNYADSLEVMIPPTGDTISVIINNLPEKSYSFLIKTFDEKGISSIPVELLSGSFGEKYQAQLLNRPVNGTVIDETGKITIQWGNADISSGAFASEVKYTDILGNIKIASFPADTATSSISDFQSGSRYQYRTMFKPDSMSIDNFYTDFADCEDFTIDKTAWKIAGFSDQYSEDNGVKYIIDGINLATRWHTDGSAYPHWATIDMGAVRTITKFGVWRTTRDTPRGDVRAPIRIQFLISMDNVTWTDLGSFDFNNLSNDEQNFTMPASSTGRYFKFVGLVGPTGNNQYMTLGEISAYGS